MRQQLELSHLVLQVSEPEALAPALGDVVGLLPGEPDPAGAATWRNDRQARRIIVEQGPAEDAIAIGFESPDADSFEATVARLLAGGATVAEDTGLADRRRVERLAGADAPWGGTVELVTGPADATEPFASPLVPGGFVTDGVGFGHVVLATPHFDESVAFLTDGLGFDQSDWLELDLGAGLTLEVRFFHCNPRHHTVALARAPFEPPQRLHHLMVEMTERDDVGAAFDRLWATDLPIPSGLGRHDNDGMFSFYLQTPAGFQIEVGHGGRLVTPDWDDNRRYDAISAWGHQPLRRP